MSEPTKCPHMEPECCGQANRDGSCCGNPVPTQCFGCDDCQPPATPLPAVDPMDEVVGRVTNYLDKVRAFVKRDDASEMLDEPEYFATLDHADLRKLLAAYQSVREEIAHQKQVAEDAEVRAMVATARLAARGREEGT